jgi:hypothetical protein
MAMRFQKVRWLIVAPLACAAVGLGTSPASAVVGVPGPVSVQSGVATERGGTSLESAAAKAGQIGRAVAISLIGLAFALAGVVLAFRRDFKEAAGVFVVGMIALLLASPAGVALLSNTVTTLFGAG